MKYKFLQCLLAFMIVLPTFSQKYISVKGKDIIGVDGKPFLIKGTNLGNWLVPEGYMFKFQVASSPRLINELFSELFGPSETKKFWKQYLASYITKGDIQYLHSLGMNSIRVPFNYRLFTDEYYLGGYGIQRGFALMDSVVKWCAAENMTVILDMHAAPGGQTGDNIDDSYAYPFLFESKEDQELLCTIWTKIAAHYKNNPTIMGYDLLNEPIAHFFDTTHLNPFLESLFKKVTAAVRKVDKNHLIFLEGAQWASNFSTFGKPFDNKLVYQFHKYWTPTTIEVIQSYIDFRNKYNVPIYCGETGENDDEWVANFRKLLEQNNIGWHFWPYKKMNNTRGIVSFPQPENYELISKYSDTARTNFDEVRKNKPAQLDAAKKAWYQFLENCKSENIIPNKGYIKALGLKAY
ncbi:MAG: cellulase family glycosylhydrolase [Bacteroidota bacterium]